MAPRTVATSHGEAIGPLEEAALQRARRLAKGKAALTAEEEAEEAAWEASQTSGAEALPLGKVLASTEKRIRDGAIRSLAAFLSRPSGGALGDNPIDGETEERGSGDAQAVSSIELVSPSEMAKLWKGIFYCFWMSDKPLVQQALASELADLVLLIAKASPKIKRRQGDETNLDAIDLGRVESALAFLQGFWAAMAREWPLVDKHRVDKYLLLMRRFTCAGFRLCQLTGWDSAVINRLNEIMLMPSPALVSADEASRFSRGGPGPLAVHDIKLPDSISYHVADIWLDELERTLSSDLEQQGPSSSAQAATPLPLPELLWPICAALARVTVAKMYERMLEPSLQAVVDDLRKAEDLLEVIAGESDNDDDETGGNDERDAPANGVRTSTNDEEESFDDAELWEGLSRAELMRRVLAHNAALKVDGHDGEVNRPAKRSRLQEGHDGSAETGTPSRLTAATLLARVKQLKLELMLSVRKAARAPVPPTNPARARALEKLVRENLSTAEDPEPHPADEVLSEAERKRKMERAKARLLRKKRNVEMQMAIQRKAAKRKEMKAKVRAQSRAAAAKSQGRPGEPVVVGPALARKVSGRRKK